MHAFWGVVRYEYRMTVRRWGVWLAFAIASFQDVVGVLFGGFFGVGSELPEGTIWQLASLFALGLNFFLPVVAGIAMADRLPRDFKLGVNELLCSSPLSRRSYVVGKYLGTLLGVLTPAFAVTMLIAALLVGRGVSPWIIGACLVAFLAINVPAFVFVGAFSVACPAVLPVRVYQVLFTGYWFWGNYLNPNFIPSLSDTLLVPSGKYVGRAFFDTIAPWSGPGSSQLEAVLNLCILAACAAVALVAVERYLTWQASRA